MSDYKDYREEQQKRRRERLPRRQKLILGLREYGYKVTRKSDYQFRVEKQDSTIMIDTYPIHLRYHVINTKRRGQIRGEKNIVDFINRIFEAKQ